MIGGDQLHRLRPRRSPARDASSCCRAHRQRQHRARPGRGKRDGDAAWDWAEQFDADTAVALRDRDVTKLVNPYATWPEARIAVPTDDHYRPMAAALSLLEDDEDLRLFNDQIDMGSIGMRSFITV